MEQNKCDNLERPGAPEILLEIDHINNDVAEFEKGKCFLWKHQSYIHVYGTILSAYKDYVQTCKVFKVEAITIREFEMHLRAPYGQVKHWTGQRLQKPHDTHFNCIVITTKELF